MTDHLGQSGVSLVRHAAGDYRTLDGRWQILRPDCMDNGLQHRWIIREWTETGTGDGNPGWFALDDDYATLREARQALAGEMR